MKHPLVIFLLLGLPLLATAQNPFTYEHDGLTRSYFLYLPNDLPAGAPLVFVLHGYTSSAAIIMDYSEMNDQADQNGFAVCYPQGTPDFGGTTHWNANLNISNTDDIGFLSELAQYLQSEYDLNPEHTFSCGMSNGGFMSYTLACERPDVFKAIASVTGTMSGYDWNNCDPSEVVPVFQISGINDNVVPFDGDWNPGGGWNGAPGAIAVNDFWVDLNETTASEIINLSANLAAEYYTGGIDDQQVWFYPIDNWGHQWPVSWTSGLNGITAAEEIWDFFELVVAGTTSTEGTFETEAPFAVYPNPTTGEVNIRTKEKISFRLMTQWGTVLYTGILPAENARIDISLLPAGFYFLCAGEWRFKVVKK